MAMGRRVVMAVAVAVWAATACAAQGKATPPAGGSFNDIPPDLLQEIDKADVRKLIQDLALAGRIDRRGQELMKGRARLEAALLAAKREQARWQAAPEVVATLGRLQQPAPAARLNQVRSQPPARKKDAYLAFLKEHNLEHEWVVAAANLRTANLLIVRCESGLKQIAEWQTEHEKMGQAVRVHIEFVDSDLSLTKVDETLKVLDPKTKDPRAAVREDRPQVPDNLEFLKAFGDPAGK